MTNMTSNPREATDAEIEEMLSRFAIRLLSPRPLFVTLIYAAALSLSGISTWKTLIFCPTVWLLMVLPLGRRYLEKIGGIWLFVALVIWLDIPAINRLIEAIGAKIFTIF